MKFLAWARKLVVCAIPESILDEENISRVAVHPFHFAKGKLSQAAFRPPPGDHEISVIRSDYLHSLECKRKGVAIANAKGDGCAFTGFAVLKAGTIRSHGSTVYDSRHVYCGHADISHGVVLVKNEPLPPQINERLKTFAKLAIFVSDPAPNDDGWGGGLLLGRRLLPKPGG